MLDTNRSALLALPRPSLVLPNPRLGRHLEGCVLTMYVLMYALLTMYILPCTVRIAHCVSVFACVRACV